ncbi:hypothetical protein M3J09_004352 [Ascochyta lentis]
MAKKPAAAQHFCGRCSQTFSSRQALNQHLLNHPESAPASLKCSPSEQYDCDRCSQTFSTQREYNQHRKLGQPCCDAYHSTAWKKSRRSGYVDPNEPKSVFKQEPILAYGGDLSASPQAPAMPSVSTGLKMHQTDAHSVGGNGLDLHGRDSWMLSQRERERIRAEAPTRSSTDRIRGGGDNRGNRGGRAPPVSAGAASTRAPLPDVPAQRAPATRGPYSHVPSHHSGSNIPPSLPTSQNIGGALEMEQAKSVCGKTLRLLLQTDVFIHHNGKMSVSGIDWTRIGVDHQPTVVDRFDDMCHLPRKLQPLEYVPAPKTFMTEYTAQYPVIEFESAPDRNPTKPGLDIIAMACSKIFLSNGSHEVVKIAIIDVLTCRVLMSHLICTDPGAEVGNWCSSITGLTSFQDIEDARQSGYKVLKGWAAARSALFRLIDKDTIIVGHNLRSELDALRIIHGRAVDIAKAIEKAAQGPLSKVQVSLDSWCRDVANVAQLKTDPVFGRDCIMSAFAAREIGLWVIKNREQFVEVAKQKTKEYQLVTPLRL